MQISYDTALIEVCDTAFEISECYCFMLLPEQNLNWWEGHVTDLAVIYGLRDLAVALFVGLDAFGYERVTGKKIEIHREENGRYLLDVPFQVKDNPKEQDVTRFILYPLKGIAQALGQ